MIGAKQLERRIEENARTTERALDGFQAQLRDHSQESRASIRDLSEQTRGQFKAVREETESRHRENKRLIWGAFVSLMMTIIAAVAANYLAAHGFTSPAATGATQAAIIKSLDKIDGTLKTIEVQERTQRR